MEVNISIDGLKELQQAIQEAKASVRAEAERAVAASTFRVQSAAVRRIQRGPASGEVYELYEPRRTHQASAKGQPPMSDTGRLASSVETRTDGMTGYVFTRVKYGPYLEFGTSKMDPRPWLFPSVEEDAPRFMADLRGLLK